MSERCPVCANKKQFCTCKAGDERVETVTDDKGRAEWTIVTSLPEGVWYDEDGKPGWVRFAVYEINGTDQHGNHLYWRKGESTGFGATDWRDAEIAAWGDIKWDGCLNYMVGEQGTMIHDHHVVDVRARFAAVTRAVELAAEWCGADPTA